MYKTIKIKIQIVIIQHKKNKKKKTIIFLPDLLKFIASKP